MSHNFLLLYAFLGNSKYKSEANHESSSKASNMNLDQYKYVGSLYNQYKSDQNWIVSPVTTFLSMILALDGASTETQEEIFEKLGFSRDGEEITTEAVYDFVKRGIYEKITDSCSENELRLVNLCYLKANCEIKSSYRDNEREHYGASVDNMDFTDPKKTVDQINQKVLELTKNMMTGNVLESMVRTDTSILLVNALCHHDAWSNSFDPRDTKKMEFRMEGGMHKEIPFMDKNDLFIRCLNEKANTVKDLGITGVMIHFNEQTSLVLVLPKEGESLEKLNEKFVEPEGDLLEFVCSPDSYYGYGIVHISLPRFKLEQTLDQTEILQSMGITEAFKDSADFSQMTESRVHLSGVLHQTHLRVTEAGSGNAKAIKCKSAGDDGIAKHVIFDRPFFVALVLNEDCMPLLMGNVWNPEDLGMNLNEYRFVTSLYSQCQTKADWITSPVGLFLSMVLALDAAAEKTQKEIFNKLGFSEEIGAITTQEVYELVNSAIYGELTTSYLNGTMKVANLCFLTKNCEFKEDYSEEEKSHYKAAVANMDFSNPNTAARRINKEINDVTERKIHGNMRASMIKSNMSVILINALCYEDSWLNSFDPKNSTNMIFKKGFSRKLIPYMHKTALFKCLNKNVDSELIGVMLEFNRSANLVVVMPKSLEQLNKKFAESGDLLKSICSSASYEEKKLDLYLPRFKLEQSLDQTKILESMGMKEAFEDSANFSQMTDSQAKLSMVFQQTTLHVNEDGSGGVPALEGVSVTNTDAEATQVKFESPFFVALVLKEARMPVLMGNVWDPQDPGKGNGFQPIN
ncbi:Serine Protease Inhibitor (serpin) [Cichlidogyrus casuarinus]|uniref:Serine Protease Inhibitor (Serpin) n=1 Tax=Cichlidogyrus casuarinus TaxID=1844966 RepID=A0ABD2PYN5_9PLAT